MVKSKMHRVYFFLALLITFFTQGFNSLQSLITFTQTHKEYPDADNNSPAHPRYTTFYYKNAPTFWQKFLTKIGLQHTNSDFYKELEGLTQKNIQAGMLKRYALTLKVPKGSQFLILGNPQGEIHSLARILEALFKNNSIDQSFKLLIEDLYLVLNGNMFANSPYALETLKLIITILKANPKKAFYIKGFSEDKERWLHQSLGEQITIQLSDQSDFLSLIKKFFNTLPLAIYILAQDSQEPPIRISYYGIDYSEFSHLQCVPVNSPLPHVQTALCTLDTTVAQPQGPLTALITSASKYTNYSTSRGLQFIDKSPPTWDILSSPSLFYREKFSFFYDAFAVLTIGSSLKSSLISLFNQNTYKEGFKLEATYDIKGKKIALPHAPTTWDATFKYLSTLATQSTQI